MHQVAVFVVDGHDIELYADAEAAAGAIEGDDAETLEYFGADGTVYTPTVSVPTKRATSAIFVCTNSHW